MIHESKYMILRRFESVVVRIAHFFVDFCTYFSVEAYLQRERAQTSQLAKYRHALRAKDHVTSLRHTESNASVLARFPMNY